jgi:uncharacterized lipoprotein YddW (UPF0748 family)
MSARSRKFAKLRAGPRTSIHIPVAPRLILQLLGALIAGEMKAASYQIAYVTTPPPIQREFRAAWIPTVGNSCWPSKPGLTTGQQKAELIALLDRAAELKLNAVVFQVRPACDALYKSDLEPWSEYLTGTQGKAPAPYYDPLEFAVAEAHKRGLELHAWFNPYRARHKTAKSTVAANHITRTQPALVRNYGEYLWLDPGERAVQDHALRVVLDVVKRYDIDAVHFDDYFYPYPEKNTAGNELGFPDAASWQKSGTSSGLSRPDWRRRNVDQFIQRIYQSIHEVKPQVKFGLSPFGIWRPKTPPGIEGLDAYDKLYADARKWLREGWCDYMAPQLYWASEPREQSFPMLLKWWSDQNPKRRHLWPGINSLKVGAGWSADEITKQIQLTRKLPTPPGQIHWSESALMRNASLQNALTRDAYRQPALVPRYTWLDATAPPRPAASLLVTDGLTVATWSASSQEKPWLWVVQTRQFGDWKIQILPGDRKTLALNLKPELVAVTAVDRCGNASSPVVLKLVQ